MNEELRFQNTRSANFKPLIHKATGKKVCSATHPDNPNFDGHARGRKTHLAKDENLTYCNMLIADYKFDYQQPHLHNYCKSCLHEAERAQTELPKPTIKLNAYFQWLLQQSNGNRGKLIALIKDGIAETNPQTYDLLEATQDVAFNAHTFEKAADLLINSKPKP